jgi:hypothetical protein
MDATEPQTLRAQPIDAIRMTDHELGVDHAGEPGGNQQTDQSSREAINGSCPPRAPDASGEQSESVRYTIAFGPLLHTAPADIQDRDGDPAAGHPLWQISVLYWSITWPRTN